MRGHMGAASNLICLLIFFNFGSAVTVSIWKTSGTVDVFKP